jgi:DNA-binding transcriptional LysR family regulator
VAQLVRSCEKGEIDLGLIPYPSCCGRDLVTEPLFEEEIKIGISRSHRLSNLSSISLADLNGEKIVLLNEDHHLSNVIQDVLAEQHVEAKVSAQVESFALLNYLVSLNHGIGFFPSSAIPKQINKNVCFLPIEGKPMTRSLALCWNGRRYQTQLMTNFVKALQEFSFVDLKPYDGTLFSDQDSQVEQNGVAKPKNSRALAVPAVLK